MRITLTQPEADAVQTLLAVVLQNADQWEAFELTTLASARRKLTTALAKAEAKEAQS